MRRLVWWSVAVARAAGGRLRGKVTFTSACAAPIAYALAACAGGAPPASTPVASPPARVVPVAVAAAPSEPAATRPTPLHFAGRLLHPIPQKPLTRVPDVWDPDGESVGVYVRGRKPRCELWDVRTALYRGPVPPAVCAAWKAAEGHGADGRHVVAARGRLVVRGGTAPAITLAADCAGSACGPFVAIGISRDGAEVAAVRRGAHVVAVWDTTTGAIARHPTLPFAANDVGAVRVSERGEVVVKARLSAAGFWTVFDFPPGTDKGSDAELADSVDTAAVDPFGHWVFVAGTQFFHGRSEPFRSVHGTGGVEDPPLAWDGTPPRVTSAVRLAADGRTCVAITRTEGEAGWTTNEVSLYRAGDAPRARHLDTNAEGKVLVDLSPDGAKAVWVRDLGTRVGLRVASSEAVDDGRNDTVLPPGMPRAVALSADAARVALGYDGHVEVRRPHAQGVDLFWAGQDRFAWSPSAATVLAASGGGRVTVRDVGNRTVRFTAAGRLASPAFSPDGRRLALIDARGVTVVDARGWKVARRLAVPRARAAAFGTADRVAVAGAGGIVVFEGTGKHAVTLAAAATAVAFSDDGGAVHARLADGTWRVFQLDLATRHPRVVRRAGVLDPSGRFVCTPDGALVRLRDGLVLRAVPGGAMIDDGAYAGADLVMNSIVYRAGDDAVRGELIAGLELTAALRRDDLLEAFFRGDALERPEILAP